MPELDQYEQEGIDNEFVQEANIQQRRDAERELNQIERMQVQGRSRQAAALIDDDQDEDDEDRMLR